jgi:elongation factor 1-beta
MSFGDLSSASGLAALNDHLKTRSYVSDWTPSQADVTVFAQVSNSVSASSFPHVARWAAHIGQFAPCSRGKWAAPAAGSFGASLEAKGKGGAAAAAASAASSTDAVAAEPASEEFDPFADSGQTEEEKAKEEEFMRRAAEKHKKDEAAGKKSEMARSMIVLDVKPEGSETDMVKLEEKVRAITMEGLNWKGSELKDVAYGIRKLQIICIIEDEKVQQDDLVDEVQKIEDLVQSCDIVLRNRM